VTNTHTVDPDIGTSSRSSSRRGSSRRSAQTIWTVRAAAAAAALLSLLSDAAPTGILAADVVWRAGAAAGLALLASRATRASWLWMTALATVVAVGSWALLLAAPALALVAYTTRLKVRPRTYGAAIGALSAGALLLLPDLGPHGVTSLVVAAAVVPVGVTAYQRSSRRVQKKMRRGAFWATVAVVVAGGAAAVAGGLAAMPLVDGIDRADQGLDQVANGDQEAGARSFQAAGDDLDRAEGLLSGPWMAPARALPVVSQHVRALADAATTGGRLTHSAEIAATVAPYRELKTEGGRIDLARMAEMQEPVAEAAAELRRADETLADVRSPWLIPPAADALDRFDEEVTDALPEAELADHALRVAPALLGAEGDRRYLVLFTTPAESRNLGGFTGSYGILEARGGDVELIESGPINELNLMGDYQARTVEGQEEFLLRYDRYQPERYFQNLTVSPDMETTAEVAAGLYQQATGTPVDGVMVADPFALAAMLELTGPIDVPSVGFPLDADNAAEFLLRDQYVLYENETDARRDRLEDVAEATFDALTERSLPGPRQLGQVLGPMVEQKRLLFFPLDAEGQDLIDDVGALGRLERPGGSDLLSVRMANLRPNKIDTFIHRSITYDATYDSRTGAVDATVTVVVRNDAPASGLPAYVIGAEGDREPPGTSRLLTAIYTPLEATGATLDGEVAGLGPQTEVGLNVFTAALTIPAGGEVTLEVQLTGTVPDMGDTYRLLASSQPLANPDELTVQIRPAPGAPELGDVRGLEVVGGVATDAGPWITDRRYTIRLDEG
jgi:hypothetical protein